MTEAKKTIAASKTKSSSGSATDEQSQSTSTGNDAESLLKADHRKVEKLFQDYEKADDTAKKSELARNICMELVVHTKIEEELFYPACREKNVEHEMLDEAQVEHDGAKILIAELLQGSPDDQFYDAKVTVLAEYIKHHVAEEEKPDDGIFASAREAEVDMDELGKRIQSRKTELTARSDALMSRPPMPRSLRNPAFKGGEYRQEENSMPRYSNDRDRDQYGRFTNEEDGRRGEYSSRRRYEEDDDYGRHRGNDRPRDEEGRFTSERGQYRGGYESRSSRYDDDDDHRSSRGGRGHGGWYGDSEGHSEASERGWEGRGSRSGYSSRSSSRYEDEDDHRSSRGGRGHGGWFGDPEGHSEASERGWEHRGASRGGSSSRSSRDDDEDDRRSSRSGRHGGWFGDSRGHSEAARRGWEDR